MNNHREYTIQYGDTLQSLSARFYNDARRWLDIARYNDLDYPYITNTPSGQPKVRTIGDTILIPLDPDVEQRPVVDNWIDEFCGEDFALHNDFGNDIYGDLATVVGLENLALALTHRFETERGELIYHPEYGSNLHMFVGRTEPFINKMIELEILETAYQDPRVEHIEVRFLERSGRKLMVECLITVVGQETPSVVPLNLTLGRG